MLNNKICLFRIFLFQFRAYYCKLASYLAANLPFNNSLLHNLSFIGMHDPICEKEVCSVASKLPTVISDTEISELQTEIRLFNLRKDTSNSDTDDPAKAWHCISQMSGGEFERLSRLALACCTLFHGNSDVERHIGKSHDLDDNEKRSLLSGTCTIASFNGHMSHIS